MAGRQTDDVSEGVRRIMLSEPEVSVGNIPISLRLLNKFNIV